MCTCLCAQACTCLHAAASAFMQLPRHGVASRGCGSPAYLIISHCRGSDLHDCQPGGVHAPLPHPACRSPFIEWFHRLLVPGAHYAQFWADPNDRDDVLKAVHALREVQGRDPEALAAAAAANQQVVARWAARGPHRWSRPMRP